MRLEEYSQLIESDSPTIEFFTKNGKTILCQKQVDDMKKQLEQAKDLLQAMIEAKDIPTIEVIHRLCDLAKVLDHLRFQEECLVVGDCAITLARAFGSRAVEFQKEEAQTILLIARLNVYKSRACPLFIQAISIYDAFVILDGSDFTKAMLLGALDSAGAHDETPPALCAQWLGRAVDLISELPSTMVADELRGSVYINYGSVLCTLKAHSKAVAAGERAVAFYRSLDAGHDQMMYKNDLALALFNYGITLYDMRCIEAALIVNQEAVSLYRTLAVDGHEEHKRNLARALYHYGITLRHMGHLEDTLSVTQEVVSLYRALAIDGHEEHKSNLAGALCDYGYTLCHMGRLEAALSVRQETVSDLSAVPWPLMGMRSTKGFLLVLSTTMDSHFVVWAILRMPSGSDGRLYLSTAPWVLMGVRSTKRILLMLSRIMETHSLIWAILKMRSVLNGRLYLFTEPWLLMGTRSTKGNSLLPSTTMETRFMIWAILKMPLV